jgi:hypothetical protein
VSEDIISKAYDQLKSQNDLQNQINKRTFRRSRFNAAIALNSATPESFQEVHNIQLVLDLQIRNFLQDQR